MNKVASLSGYDYSICSQICKGFFHKLTDFLRKLQMRLSKLHKNSRGNLWKSSSPGIADNLWKRIHFLLEFFGIRTFISNQFRSVVMLTVPP